MKAVASPQVVHREGTGGVRGRGAGTAESGIGEAQQVKCSYAGHQAEGKAGQEVGV